MIRLSWRQFRLQAAVGAAGLVIVAVALAITGPHLTHLYDTTVATCKAQGDCSTATTAFLRADHLLQNALTALLLVVPALLGIFWGAPLIARELETGTFRLAWTQSVTRTRWLAAKLAVTGLSVVIVTGLLSLMVTLWSHPIDRVNANQFTWTVFDARNLAPIGYGVFAFALGAAAGTLIRRTLPAMAATLGGFIAVRFAISDWVRPNLLAPAHTSAALDAGGNIGFLESPSGVTFVSTNPVIHNAWTISSAIVDHTGRVTTTRALAALILKACPKIAAPPSAGGSGQPDPAAFQDCVNKLATKFHLAVTYQPASRYWSIQWLELAVYVALALILAAVCFRTLRHRLS